MPSIEWVSTLDNRAFVKSMTEIQSSMYTTASNLQRLGNSFNIDGVVNQLHALNKALRENDAEIAASRERIAQWSEEARKAREAGDFVTFDNKNLAIQDEMEVMNAMIPLSEKYKQSINEILGIYNELGDKKPPLLFGSQEDFDHARNLKTQIIELRAEISNFKGSDEDLQGLNDKLTSLSDELRDCEDQAAENAASLGAAGKTAAEATSHYFELTNKIKEQRNAIASLTVQLNAAAEERRKAIEGGDPQEIEKATLKYDALSGAVSSAKQQLSTLQIEQSEFARKMNDMGDTTVNVGKKITDTFKSIAAVAGISFSLNEAKNFVQRVVDMRAYFQDIESSMKVFLGSAEAGAEFTQKLKDYAYYNMFEFKDLAQASQQMIAYGHNVDSIIGRIDQLSNVAVGTHGSLMELVDAYNRAKSTGVVDARGIQSWAVKGVMIKDVLKEMGEEAVGSMITFEQLNKVLDKVTGDGGMFHNLQLSMMENISAEIGQFQDNFDSMLNEIGEKYQDTITDVIKFGSGLVDNYKEIGKIILDIVAAFGAYKAALFVANASEAVSIAWKERWIATSGAATASTIKETVAMNTNTFSKNANANAAKILTAANKLLNASILANPYLVVGAAIGALTFTIYKLVTAEDAETAARRRANEQMEDFKSKLDEQKDRVNQYISTIQDSSSTAYEQALAWKQLQNEMPFLAKQYDMVTIASMDFGDAQKKVKEAIEDIDFQHAEEEIKKWQNILQKVQEGGIKNLTKDERESFVGEGFSTTMSGTVSKDTIDAVRGYIDELKKAHEEVVAIREEAERTAREEATPIEIRIKEANDNISAKKEILDFYDRAMLLARDLEESNNGGFGFVAARSNFENFIKELEDGVEQARKDMEKNPLNPKFADLYEEKKKLLDEIKDVRSAVHADGLDVLTFKVKLSGLTAAWSKARDTLSNLFKNIGKGMHLDGNILVADEDEEKNTSGGWQKKLRKRLQVAQKELDDFVNERGVYAGKKMTQDERDDTLKRLNNAVKAAKDALGSDSTKAENKAAVDSANRIAKLAEISRKEEEERKDQARRTADAVASAKIAAERNASERERMELENQHRLDLEKLKEAEEDFRKKNFDVIRARWEASNTDKTKHFTDTKEYKDFIANPEIVKLTEDQQAELDARRSEADAKYLRQLETRARAERQQQIDFLKQWGDYEQQKLAVTQEYEEKIRDASSQERVGLMLQRDEELKKLEAENIQSNIDWSGVFSDLQGHTEKYLIGLRQQLQSLLDGGQLPVDQMSVIQDKIREINGEIQRQGGMFNYVSEAQMEYNRRVQAAADAQEALNAAQREQGDIIAENLKAEFDARKLLTENGLDADLDLNRDVLNNFDKDSEQYKQMEAILDKLTVGEVKLANARKKTAEATQKNAEAQDAADERLDEKIARHLGNVNQWVQTYLSDLPALLDELGLGGASEKVSQGLSAVNSAAGAAADFASQNYVGAALKAVSAIKDFGRVLGVGGGNAAEINKELARLSERNEILTKAIDRLNDTMGKQGGANAIRTYEELVKLQKELEKNLQQQISLQMDYHEAHHSFDYYWNNVNGRELERFNNLHNTSWNGSLDNLDAQTASAIMSDVNIVELIKNTGKGGYGQRVLNWIEQLAAEEGKLKEQTDALYASLTAGTTRESVFSDFLNQLYDLADGSEDVMDNIAKNWQQMVNKMVINNIIGADMQKEIDAWYDELAQLNMKHSDGLIDDEEYGDELEAIRLKYENQVNMAQKKIEEFTEAGIIKPIEEAANETLITLDTIKDGWMNMLMDMSADVDDWSQDIARLMTQALIEDNIFNDEWEEKQQEWIDRYNEAIKDKSIGDAQRKALLKGLQDEQEAWVEENRRKAREIYEMTGYGQSTTEQTASVQAMGRITVDQADELIGRMNAGQLIWEQQRELQSQISATLSSLNDAVGVNTRNVGELVSLALTRNERLGGILDACVAIRADMNEQMEGLRRELNKI